MALEDGMVTGGSYRRIGDNKRPAIVANKADVRPVEEELAQCSLTQK